MKFNGNGIYLKNISEDEVTEDYVQWMNDNEVVRFLDSNWRVYTLDSLKEYIKEANNNPNDFLFGIFLNDSDEHIGNIKIVEISYIHRHGHIGVLIGRRDCWGKGLGAESIKLVTEIAFKHLNLNKLIAAMHAENVSCFKTFIKAGYNEIGRLRKHFFYNGGYVDRILVEIIKE